MTFMFLDVPIKENYFNDCGCDCDCDDAPNNSFIIVLWNWLFSSKDSCGIQHDNTCPCNGLYRGGIPHPPTDYPSAYIGGSIHNVDISGSVVKPASAPAANQTPYQIASTYCASYGANQMPPSIIAYCNAWAAAKVASSPKSK